MFSEELLKKAQAGELQAALEVANCYYRGVDVEEDNEKAFFWYSKVLELDPENVTALTNLGSCYRCGYGTEKNHTKAIEFYERAIKHHSKGALWYLAEYLYNGEYVEKNLPRATELYIRAANLGDVDAQVKLGDIYRDGEIVEVNHEVANRWYTMAMEQGDADAIFAMAKAYYAGLGVEQDIPKSTELWKKSAELGHWGAQFITGVNYEDGEGVEPDMNEAVRWYTLAAEQGHLKACHRLGNIYRCGEKGIGQDFKKAIRYYETAFNGKHPETVARVGLLNFEGDCGLEVNKEKAFEIWKYGSDLGYAACSIKVGRCYKFGEGTAQNSELAIEYFEKAAAQGSIDAMLELGYAYDENGIAASDMARAAEYYKKAYELGSVHGAFCLGTMYEKGNGVEQDPVKAVELYKAASDNGHIKANIRLGILTYDGKGTEKDVLKAVEYFERAKAQGDTSADNFLAYVYEHASAEDGLDPKKVFAETLRLANEGNADAQFSLYNAYINGDGVEQNRDEAFVWLRRAADNGHVVSSAMIGYIDIAEGNLSGVNYLEKACEGGSLKAMFDLGVMYFEGDNGVPINKQRGIELIKRAADAGYTAAQSGLGRWYLIGKGVEVNHSEAVRLLKLAADKGDVDALRYMGLCFKMGYGVQRDNAAALYWFEKAAAQGCCKAKLCAADMYADGDGIAPDYFKAEAYYLDAMRTAEGDYLNNAIFNLALLYANKMNTPEKSFPYWKIAAENGDSKAAFNLGLCYYRGAGTPVDKNLALFWFRQAAAKGDADAADIARSLEAEIQNGGAGNSVSNSGSTTQSSGSTQSSGGCYVATAVYGSYDCPEVWTLRRFRDGTLAETWYGRVFIRLYYAVSPSIVKFFGGTEWFNRMWRGALDRMVSNLQNSGVESTPYEDKNIW